MTILLLAGTGEARRLADAFVDAGRKDVIASLSGATRMPTPLSLETRVGGFGGWDGQVEFIKSNEISAVIDASHPFAHRISDRSAKICRSLNIPYLQVLRPEWRPEEGDRWLFVKDGAEASEHIRQGSRVFLAVGRQTLTEFSSLTGSHLICRQIDAPETQFPFPNGEFLVGRPPFSVEDEAALFQRLQIDWLVVKNAGGAASKTKLTAARQLGIPVLMLERPLQPVGDKVKTVGEAMAWAASQ
ncbi:MAG: cobalt-precorrin-6A reductase [Pseudoruegeria sp.]